MGVTTILTEGEEFSTVARDNTQSNKIYLDGNTIFIQEKLFNFCLKKIMPSDIYAQISSIKITDKDIRIIHRELGLLIAVKSPDAHAQIIIIS